MNKTLFFCIILSAFLLFIGKKPVEAYLSAIPYDLNDTATTHEGKPGNNEVVQGLPKIGKWMFDPDYKPSQWSDKELDDKIIREPINIIIADSISKTGNEAEQNLLDALEKAGYKNRWGHASGFKGLIDNIYCNQFPSDSFHSISDESFLFDNNHGRIFGPYYKNGTYYFTGAMSRESGYYHDYISFGQARDGFVESLSAKTNYKLIRKVWLNNLINKDNLTTGDHDGYAVLISVGK
jgi:hypothetical protein